LPLSDARPAEVIQAEQEVARLLRNYYTSISIAVLVWDEITILTGDDDQGRGIGVYVTTKGIVVKHDRPLRVLPSQVIEALQPQSQVDFFVHREDREWVSNNAGRIIHVRKISRFSNPCFEDQGISPFRRFGFPCLQQVSINVNCDLN